MIGDGDIEAIFSNGDFDVVATFPGSRSVSGWFTDGTQQVSVFTNEIEAVNPMFDFATSETGSLKRGDTVTINGTDYTVERKQVLATGVTTLHLKT